VTEENIKRMWLIDGKVNVGSEITNEEREFYNAHYELMIEEVEDDYNHWKYHSSRL
jgi:hypothetical protein